MKIAQVVDSFAVAMRALLERAYRDGYRRGFQEGYDAQRREPPAPPVMSETDRAWEIRACREHEFYFGHRRGARSPDEIDLSRA